MFKKLSDVFSEVWMYLSEALVKYGTAPQTHHSAWMSQE